MMKKDFILALSLLLLGFAPLSAQRASNGYPYLSYWDFHYWETPDSVDCRFTKNKELFLSGFDTDGAGTFYFAGGNPLRVSCFKGTTLQWRRKVSDIYTTRGLFRLRGDSLYLVHDRTHELIVLSKDGKGDVRYVKLATDDIDEGVMHENYFVLRDKGWKPEEIKDLYTWANLRFKLSFFNYRGELAWTDEMTREYSIRMLRPTPYDPQPYKDVLVIDYKGVFRGMHLFANLPGKDFLLTSFGETLYSFSIPGDVFYSILPLAVFNDEIDIESHYPSPEGGILRGNHYYYVGYETGSNHLMVVDIDLDKMFPDAVNWMKKMLK